MNKEDLEKFCEDCTGNSYISKPWSRQEYSYATNGYLILRISRLPGIDENPQAPDVFHIFMTPQPEVYYPMEEIHLEEKEWCKECDGQGVNVNCPECHGVGDVDFDNDYHTYSFACESCDGTGKIKKCKECKGTGKVESKKNIDVGNATFQNQFLQLLKSFPNCKIGPNEPQTPAWFVFDGGDGLIMPTNKR